MSWYPEPPPDVYLADHVDHADPDPVEYCPSCGLELEPPPNELVCARCGTFQVYI